MCEGALDDRLDAEGNDYPVEAAGYPTRAVADWHECAEAIAQIVGELGAR